VQRYQKGIIL